MTGPPPCAYGQPCLWDDNTSTCPCETGTPPEVEDRPVVDVLVGHYL